MRIKVVRAVKDGEVGYLSQLSAFGGVRLSPSPAGAIDYALPNNADELVTDLLKLRLPEDENFAKSSFAVESAEVVEFKLTIITRTAIRSL